MFYSKVRDRYLYIKYVYGIVNIIFWSVYSVWVAIVLILNANPSWRTKNFDFFMLAMLINGIVGSVGAIIAIFFSHFCKKHFFKKYLYELMEESYLKKINFEPKVLYIYATHNDFMSSRLMQNINQNYKNLETWVSDGSDKLEVSNAIKTFCDLNKINLFKMERPSISKADNINSFLDFYLNKLKRSYDYLMICDADVAINKNFIKSNINFFYSKAFKNLGAITSQILQYKIDNVFANLNRLYLQNSLAYQNIQGSFDAKNGMQCFAGACMILKKEMLDDLSNGFFPNEVDEDFYLSVYCAKRSWYHFMSPLVASYEMPDKDFVSYWKRIVRLFDHSTGCLKKEKAFKNYNDKYKKFFTGWILASYSGFTYFFGLLLISLLVTSLICFSNYLFANWVQILLFVLPIATSLISTFIIFLIDHHIWKKDMLKWLITIPFGIITSIFMGMHSNFKTLILKKYSNFITSSSSNTKTVTTKSKNIKCKWFIVSCLICAVLLFILNFFFFYFDAINKVSIYMLYLLVPLDVILFWFFICTLSAWMGQIVSHIKVNPSYNPNDIVLPMKEDIEFIKVKEKFYDAHPECERIY